MPTTHTWKGAGSTLAGPEPYIYDATQYADGQPFEPGDTLVVNSGEPSVGSTSGNIVNLTTGTYVFNAGSTGAGLDTNNMGLDAASTVAITGSGDFEWLFLNRFVSDGTIQVGSPSVSSKATLTMGNVGTPTLTNGGSITVQNNSLLKLQPAATNSALDNEAGATISLSNAGALILSSYYGYIVPGNSNVDVVNNGLITVSGTLGKATGIDVQGSFQGSGLLSVRGAPGELAGNTSATIAGAANGTFDIASGKIQFNTTPVSGFVNFRDNNGAVVLDRGVGVSFNTAGYPFGATIYGFQPGDAIYLEGGVAGFSGFTYDPSSHVLTIDAGSSSLGQFTLAGNYQQGDFQVTPVELDTAVNSLEITTTSAANAIPGFTYLDTTTKGVGSQGGQQYTGPVNYLQTQFIGPTTQDGVNVTAHLPDVFLQGGAGNDALAADSGSNVLDGGFGSNFLVGATGADGGTDTFFLDGRSGTTWDTLVNFHPGDAVTLWGFVPGQSAMSWAASDGTPGYTGATIHAALAGGGTPVNGSVTFAGVSLAEAQSKFTTSTGIAGGLPYLYVKYTG